MLSDHSTPLVTTGTISTASADDAFAVLKVKVYVPLPPTRTCPDSNISILTICLEFIPLIDNRLFKLHPSLSADTTALPPAYK